MFHAEAGRLGASRPGSKGRSACYTPAPVAWRSPCSADARLFSTQYPNLLARPNERALCHVPIAALLPRRHGVQPAIVLSLGMRVSLV